MGKRSNFARKPQDKYYTPLEAAVPVQRYLQGISTFTDPCMGDGRLIAWLSSFGLECVHAGDIDIGRDALTDPALDEVRFDAFITNPPYKWDILQPLIQRFMRIAPTWLLLEADFQHNLRFNEFQPHCSDVVPIGRVKWEQDSDNEGKTNYAWYRFHIQHRRGPLTHPREKIDKATIRKSAFARSFDIPSAAAAAEPQKGNEHACSHSPEQCPAEEAA